MDTGFCFIYVTARDGAEAEAIGRALVAERLAACVNILPPIRSLYRWQGQVQEDAEAAFLVKTRADRFDAVCRRVKALHSYQVPCLVRLDIAAAEAAYGQWLSAQID